MLSQNQQDIFCLTDIAKFKNPDHPDDVIRHWLRTRSTVEFRGVWERLNNPSSNPVEFDGIRMQTGLNSFVLTPKQWIGKTGRVCSTTYLHFQRQLSQWHSTSPEEMARVSTWRMRRFGRSQVVIMKSEKA